MPKELASDLQVADETNESRAGIRVRPEGNMPMGMLEDALHHDQVSSEKTVFRRTIDVPTSNCKI